MIKILTDKILLMRIRDKLLSGLLVTILLGLFIFLCMVNCIMNGCHYFYKNNRQETKETKSDYA